MAMASSAMHNAPKLMFAQSLIKGIRVQELELLPTQVYIVTLKVNLHLELICTYSTHIPTKFSHTSEVAINIAGRYQSVDRSTGMEWWNGILE